MIIAAHSTGATSGHVATCEVLNVPYAKDVVIDHWPGAGTVCVAPPPERLGFAQAGQANAPGSRPKMTMSESKRERRFIRILVA
jgi:hypothetical protein